MGTDDNIKRRGRPSTKPVIVDIEKPIVVIPEVDGVVIRKCGERVHYLTAQGFQVGYIVYVNYNEYFTGGNELDLSKRVMKELTIRVKSEKHDKSFMGDKIDPKLLFDTYEEMIKFYDKNH